MKNKIIYKAQPLSASPEDIVPDLNLIATQTIPTLPTDIKDLEERYQFFYQEQAEIIYNALKQSLPQGVRDRIFGLMAQEKASLFLVR